MDTSLGGQVDEVGPWARRKLELLGKYLDAYTTIMKGEMWCQGYHYVDAFAGSGRPKVRGEEVFIDGSPRVALNSRHPFTSYTFIEQDPWRLAQLDQLRREFSEASIHVLEGDSNNLIVSRLTPYITYEQRRRGVAFLDPYRMNLDWSTVAAIAETRALEVCINVPTMSLNREVLLNDPSKLTAWQIDAMTRFWGADSWREAIYEEIPSLFFGPVERKIVPTKARHLGDLYRGRLHSVFPHVSKLLVIRNTTGQPIYGLVFAGPNRTGCKIANELVDQMQGVSGY